APCGALGRALPTGSYGAGGKGHRTEPSRQNTVVAARSERHAPSTNCRSPIAVPRSTTTGTRSLPGHSCGPGDAVTSKVTTTRASDDSTLGSRTVPVTPPLHPSRVTSAVNDVEAAVGGSSSLTNQIAESPCSLSVDGAFVALVFVGALVLDGGFWLDASSELL